MADATFFVFLVSYVGVGTSTWDIHYFAWGLHCGCILNTTAGSLLADELSCCDCLGLKLVENLCHAPMSHTSVALMAQYRNMCQRKLGCIIIIQTVYILQHDSADTGAPPLLEDFFKHNPNYLQKTQPCNNTELCTN